MFDIPGRRIFFYDEIESTQAPAKAAAREGAAHGSAWAADLQTAGRGRRGRSWHSIRGRDLTFSVVLRPRMDPSHAPLVSLSCALAVHGAISDLVSGASVKWPNDVLIGERKVCGIICECSASRGALEWIVAGIGINVGRREDELPPQEDGRPPATSLFIELGRDVSRAEVLASVLSRIDSELSLIESPSGRAEMIARYEAVCSTIGRTVAVISQDGRTEARAVGISPSGALVADDGIAQREFDSADVIHIR